MKKNNTETESKGKIILATVKGDIHDIGKNIVKVLLENYGFTVIDLGKDVAPEAVLEAAKREAADIVGLSALMTTTTEAMAETIALLRKELPEVKIRFINVVDLFKLQPASEHPHGLIDAEYDILFTIFGNLLEVCCFRQSLFAIEDLTTSDTGTPETYIVRIFQFLEVSCKTVLVEVVDLLLTGEGFVTGEGNDLHARRSHKESHVEAHLVVARACRAVCDSIRLHFACIACDSEGLEDTLGRHRDRVCAIAEHVTINHIADTLVVVFLLYIEGLVAYSTKFIGVLLVLA